MNVKKRIRRQVRTLDGLSAALVMAVVSYCWLVLPALPDAFWVDPGIFHEQAIKLEKAAVWRDVALMTGLYVAFTVTEMVIDRLKIDRPIRRVKPQMVTAWFKFGLLACVATIIVTNLSAVQQP